MCKRGEKGSELKGRIKRKGSGEGGVRDMGKGWRAGGWTNGRRREGEGDVRGRNWGGGEGEKV
eukprot:3365553-Pleurochrysis_carterae.AAC.1